MRVLVGDHHEDLEASQDIEELISAVSLFQSKAPVIPKNAKNPFFGSKYADLPTIVEEIKPLLAECGLAVLQLPEALDEFPVTRIVLRTIVAHVSGQWIESKTELPLSKQDPQGAGSAITYARRYGLCAALGIVADEDDDGNHASSGNKTRKVQNMAQVMDGEGYGEEVPAPTNLTAEELRDFFSAEIAMASDMQRLEALAADIRSQSSNLGSYVDQIRAEWIGRRSDLTPDSARGKGRKLQR